VSDNKVKLPTHQNHDAEEDNAVINAREANDNSNEDPVIPVKRCNQF